MAENKDDQPLSSEELLNRAREGLGVPKPPPEPSADFQVERYSTPPVDPVRSPEPEMSRSIDEDPYEMPPSSAPEPPVVDDPPLSDPSSWAPPPVEPDDGSGWRAGSPGPAPTPSTRSRSGLRGLLWIPVVLLIGGVALFSFFDGSKAVDEIAVGDCLNYPEEEVFFEIDPIDCSEPHDLEVFELVDLSTVSTEFSAASPYPGAEAVYEAAANECFDAFDAYVGTAYRDSALFLDAFTPTSEGWIDVGDRIANCVLYELDASQTTVVKSTGSQRNSQR